MRAQVNDFPATTPSWPPRLAFGRRAVGGVVLYREFSWRSRHLVGGADGHRAPAPFLASSCSVISAGLAGNSLRRPRVSCQKASDSSLPVAFSVKIAENPQF